MAISLLVALPEEIVAPPGAIIAPSAVIVALPAQDRRAAAAGGQRRRGCPPRTIRVARAGSSGIRNHEAGRRRPRATALTASARVTA
jgi:hypothetical protein